jgi:hypothetical protein
MGEAAGKMTNEAEGVQSAMPQVRVGQYKVGLVKRKQLSLGRRAWGLDPGGWDGVGWRF